MCVINNKKNIHTKMNLSSQIVDHSYEYLNNVIVVKGYPLKNYRLEYDYLSDNSIQVEISVSRGFMGLFSSGRTLINNVLENEDEFKFDMSRYLEQQFPNYNFYITDIITISNQNVVFKISYYPRAELPPDMIRKILSYLPPDQIERIYPGKDDPYLWYMMVVNNFPFIEEVPVNLVNWKRLYHEIDHLRKHEVPIIFNDDLLKLAADYDLTELVKILLLDPNIDPNNGQSYTPLKIAVSRNNIGVTELLLNDPRVVVDPEELLSIVLKENYSIMAKLISRMINPSITALNLAIYGGDFEYFQQLLPKFDPSSNDNETLLIATLANQPRVLERLLEDPRVNPSAQNNGAIAIAARKGFLEIARILLRDPRVDPSAQNNGIIITAVDNGNPELVHLILQDDRVNPSVNNNLPLLIAAKRHYADVIRVLLSDRRVNPVTVLYRIIDLIIRTWDESSKSADDRESIRNTFNVLLSDPRLRNDLQNNQKVMRFM
jgi:ankyrin repeat protein